MGGGNQVGVMLHDRAAGLSKPGFTAEWGADPTGAGPQQGGGP